MTDPEAAPPAAGRIVAILVGLFLILVFFGLSMTAPGLRITFKPPLTASSPGEVYFWLGHALLLFSGLVPDRVRGGGNARPPPRPMPGITSIACLDVKSGSPSWPCFPADRRAGPYRAASGLLRLPLDRRRICHPVRRLIFSTGHVAVKQALPLDALPSLGLFYRDGMVSRADWPGAQAVWAIGELTRLGPLVWALLAAVPVLALAQLMRRRLSARWAVVAVAVFLCSPMAVMLSMTSHAHLGSRAMLALAILGYWLSEQHGSLRSWAFTGLAFGIAFLFRPSRSLLLGAIARLRRDREPPSDPRVPGGAPGPGRGGSSSGAADVRPRLRHHGQSVGPPRLDERLVVAQDTVSNALWYRFGANVGYNTFMLTIWFLGPLGVALFAAGVMTDRFTRLLGLATVSSLGLALLHTNMGLHAVGPIHYSELAAPLVIIAVHGLANLLRTATQHRFDTAPIVSAVAASLALGLGIFNITHASALQEQAGIQAAGMTGSSEPDRRQIYPRWSSWLHNSAPRGSICPEWPASAAGSSNGDVLIPTCEMTS